MKKTDTPKTLKTLCHRTNRAAGQLLKIEQMVRDNRSPEDILLMLLAAQGSLKSLIYEHFSVIIRLHLFTLLEDLSKTENIDPALQILIDKILQKQPPHSVDELPRVFYDLRQFRPSARA